MSDPHIPFDLLVAVQEPDRVRHVAAPEHGLEVVNTMGIAIIRWSHFGVSAYDSGEQARWLRLKAAPPKPETITVRAVRYANPDSANSDTWPVSHQHVRDGKPVNASMEWASDPVEIPLYPRTNGNKI